MTLRLGITRDADLAPLFFPIEAGWAALPAETTTTTATPAELEKLLLDGKLDIAPVSPLTYAAHTTYLRILPTPLRAFDLAADSIFLISTRRLDQIDQARVAISPNSAMGEVILKIIAPSYYGITPLTTPVPSEAAALEALQGKSEACVITGEAAMRAVGWAKAKGYFVEDLTKAWWIMTGLPLPLYLFAVRQEWIEQETNATTIVRALMLSLRNSLQHSLDQRPTLLSHIETRTGLPGDVLDNHYKAQRYDMNEAHLRGLLDFYRRAANLDLVANPGDLEFFPSLKPLSSAPAGPPRRSQPEPARSPATTNSQSKAKQTNSRRTEAQARGLRVIKGGKNEPEETEEELE
jgi:chorismate dehydratase